MLQCLWSGPEINRDFRKKYLLYKLIQCVFTVAQLIIIIMTNCIYTGPFIDKKLLKVLKKERVDS